ncbi:LysR family transcriptional regulator [Mesorhizobium sp. PL10]
MAMFRSVQLITLHCALVIAEEGSFLGASRQLRIHHSALSRRIKDLELTLGVTLFQRHPSGVKTTVGGEWFLANIRRILKDLDDTLASLEAAGLGKIGRPPIGLAAPIWSCQLLDAVVAFMDDNPDVVAFIASQRKRHST